MKTNKKIVCLGGGIGTVTLLEGLKNYCQNITVVVSMADEGGSAGRLRRLYNIHPPGDLISCMAAFCPDKELLKKLLVYRFPGDRYAKDNELSGHKLGSLILVALRDLTGSFEEAIKAFQSLFHLSGTFLAATAEQVSISAKTIEGKEIVGESAIDLGEYDGKRILERVYLHPRNVKATPKVIEALDRADIIIAGPGDLYTTTLPVLIIPKIADALKKAKAKKIFIVNVANKPFETKGYAVSDYINAITKHINAFPFSVVIANNNFTATIPEQYNYSYVPLSKEESTSSYKILSDDIVNTSFPLYHSSVKLAKLIEKQL